MIRFTQSLTAMGIVSELAEAKFAVTCRSGDKFDVEVGDTTTFDVVKNLDGLDLDRTRPSGNDSSPNALTRRYLRDGMLVVVEGIYQDTNGTQRFDARRVRVVTSPEGDFLFEQTHWWLTQTTRLADQWLDALFGDTRNYDLDNFLKLYRTNLNILGLPTDDSTQECAVLSRLIYGFAAAYLLNGDERYRKAAAAGVRFQRDAFRSLSHDGRYCFWAYGRRRDRYRSEVLVPSQSGDDHDSIALYEQIYALAGLTHYFRVSMDWEVFEDIRRTVAAFNAFYLDEAREGDPVFTGKDGWFSHIDYATMRPEQNRNPANNARKNWNSVGDHIPAYLINLILTLDPLPAGRDDLAPFVAECRSMLHRCVTLILDKFTDPDPRVPFVNERFFADWKPDHGYSWQQNRAVIGHNFKIAWNLTRTANFYECEAAAARGRHDRATEEQAAALAARCVAMATRLADAMTEVGVDLIRGGCFDAVERNPAGGRVVEFSWMNTKDFWQQEQAILAYLIVYGHTMQPRFLASARQTEAFWNLYFLDHDNSGMFFRVTDNGTPIVDSSYGVRGGHSDASGYHCFELNYLAHVYNRVYVAPVGSSDASFCMFFRPEARSGFRSVNVLPDFLPPGRVRISGITVNGVPRAHFDPEWFQIEVDVDHAAPTVIVEFVVGGVDGSARPVAASAQ